MKTYLENYFILLERYYNINKVKLNNDKTKLVIFYKNSMENFFKNFTFKAGDDIIENKFSIKILGTIIQADLKFDKMVNKLSSELHNRIFTVKHSL